jgi:hypothetical protein
MKKLSSFLISSTLHKDGFLLKKQLHRRAQYQVGLTTVLEFIKRYELMSSKKNIAKNGIYKKL